MQPEVEVKKTTKGVIKTSKPANGTEERKVIFTHRIERKVKVDLTEKDRQLFKNLVIHCEILHDGKPIDEYFKNKVVEFGGRLVDRLYKNVTHLIWSNGKPKTLVKALELGIKVVTPLWLEQCISELELANEAEFAPSNLRDIQNKQNAKQMKTLAE